MMVLGAIGAAYVAFVARVSWLNVGIRNAGGRYSFLANEMRCSFPAMTADKKKGFVPTLINTPSDLPLLFEVAFFAWVVRPLKGFFCHEKLPILRQPYVGPAYNKHPDGHEITMTFCSKCDACGPVRRYENEWDNKEFQASWNLEHNVKLRGGRTERGYREAQLLGHSLEAMVRPMACEAVHLVPFLHWLVGEM